MKLFAFLLLSATTFAQIDNRYCTAQNVWVGTSAAHPYIYDGPAALPGTCLNTDPLNTPSPGPVVTVNTTQSLQAAYNAAACGTIIQLTHGGVWNDPFSFPSKGCDDQHWITITSDGDLTPPGFRIAPSFEPEMAQWNIRRNSGIGPIGDHIHFVGIHFVKATPRGGILFVFALLHGSNKVIFDRCIFSGNPNEDTQHGIVINTGKYIGIVDNWFEEFHCTAVTGTCVDSQAISGGTGAATDDITQSGHVKIVNNMIMASTENILFGGSTANGPGPVDVEIRRNYLYKPMSWNPLDANYVGTAYIVKNCFELKNGVRVLFEGNVCENVWGGYTQTGDAILFTPKNQAGAAGANLCPLCEITDLTFRYNRIHTASGFIAIGSGANDHGAYSQGQHRTSIHDNLADNLQYGVNCYSCGYSLIEMGSGYSATNPPPDTGVLSDVAINNNTIIAARLNPSTYKFQAYELLTVGGPPLNNPTNTPQAYNISFQNNLASTLLNGITATGGGTNNCASVAKPWTPANIWNTCWAGKSPFTGNVLVGYPGAVTNWPVDNLFAPDMSTVGFYDFANGVYLLPQTSPYLGKGANMDLVNAYTFGVTEEAREKPKGGK